MTTATVTTIREAVLEDFPGLFTMAREFYEEMQLPGTFDGEVWAANWTKLSHAIKTVLLVAEYEGRLEGMLGAIAIPDLYDNRIVASEMFWFARVDAGHWAAFRLLRAFHRWAEDQGAVETRLAHMVRPKGARDPDLERVYEKLGYRTIEHIWTRGA